MIFVTGGTGLLGSHLLVKLAQYNDPICAVYRSDYRKNAVRSLFRYYIAENADDTFNKIKWIKSDILDIISLRDAMRGANEIYHCAALVSFHRSDFHKLLKINREGTANVVNLALELEKCKLCYVSSTAAIGGRDGEYITEASRWKNTPTTSSYSISKYSAEKEVWRGIREGLNAVIVNPCIIIGAGRWEREGSLAIFRTLKKGVPFYPPGSNAIVDARDVSEIMIQLMKSNISAERFLCIGNNISFQKLMIEIAKQMGVRIPKYNVKRYMVEIIRRVISFIALFTLKKPTITGDTIHDLFENKSYDASKIKNALNFKFRSLSEVIENGIKGQQT